MESTCGRAGLAMSLALLAAVAGCDGHARDGATQAALASPLAAQHAAELPPAAVARAGSATSNAAPSQAAIDGNVHTLGAAGGTSVLDPDVLISEQVKAALASNPDLHTSASVDVSSRDGDVTLRGRAADPQARERAAAIARSIRNVKNVDNQITLG